MPNGTESVTEVASQRPHVHAFAGPNVEDGAIDIQAIDQLDSINPHLPCGQLDGAVRPGQSVGALATNLDGREGGRHLLDLAVEPVEQLLFTLAIGMPVMPSSYSARFPDVESPAT